MRVPKVTNTTIPAAGNSAWASATNGNGGDGDLEIDVLVEGDDDHASDGDDGLARCGRKQAAGMLEEYEEDGQQLPGDGGYGSNDDEDEPTSEEIDIIHDMEQLAARSGPHDNSDSDSKDDSKDDSDAEDAISELGDEDDKGDGDFVPKLKLKGTKHNAFKATGGKQRAQKVKDANYMFCPLSHRLSILRLVCKHFCQHPILRERHGQSQTPQQIHRDAVLETYYHCKANNLREVWAYLWMNWYAPGKWELWARSSYEHAIPRKRMTMVVEALWRNYKRMVLNHHNQPCIDLATYALVTQGIPPYWVRFNNIVNNPRDGRAKPLQGEQIPIKRAWLALYNRPTKGSYDTDVKLWLCSCGAQKYHLYLLCKHLIQKLPLPNDEWWADVVRRHTAPFYNIIDLLPESERQSAPIAAALGPRYWIGEGSALLQRALPLTVAQNLVSGTHSST